MAKKRFTLTRDEFLSWLISDPDDEEFWGKKFLRDLKKDHVLKTTTRTLFLERESIPGWLFQGQMTEDEISECYYEQDIPLDNIKLT